MYNTIIKKTNDGEAPELWIKKLHLFVLVFYLEEVWFKMKSYFLSVTELSEEAESQCFCRGQTEKLKTTNQKKFAIIIQTWLPSGLSKYKQAHW